MRCTRHISLPGMVKEIHELWQSRRSEVSNAGLSMGFVVLCYCVVLINPRRGLR